MARMPAQNPVLQGRSGRGRTTMKRLLATGLALSLLGSSAAMAHDYGHNYGHNWGRNYGHSTPYRGGYGYDHGHRYRDNGNAAEAVAPGIIAFVAVAALGTHN